MLLKVTILRFLLVAAMVGFFLPSILAETTSSRRQEVAEAGTSLDPESISRWIDQLDSEQFEERERAQSELTGVGFPALSEVAGAARSASLETSTRAINILLTWSEREDRQLAVTALEQLAAMKNRPIESARATEVLAEVRELAALEEIVSLGGSYQVNSQLSGLINLVPADHYQIIIGSEWRGGVESLKLLQDIPHAWAISFYSSPLTDEALDCLQNLPQLMRVELYGTSFSKPAIEEIRQKLPNINEKNFDVRQSAAFLGIRGSEGETAHVVDVVPDSAAAKAGIHTGDIISHLEGKEVADFAALTSLIAQYQPGETVQLTIVRQGENQELQTLELPVKLAQWGPTSRAELPELRKLNLERR
ncbi:PDZ domain-containing protein [Bythopirellula polymerisocia]|uniref:Periplasmic pH-dependent serine endoprotease DegQ n=1 Tax=Bythopirellula polymerisocia TaxID=2528003 RepID=A0A5C6CAY6_9BACT|nr:PDZ domain-containing protein [Bythopirellula polymerisocia]TWU21255.1 Periplasmic pH-dependent serine endoprotease DegQ precursor [Bythopirellula polymerisocia]